MVYLIHFQRPYRHARHYIGFVAEGGLAGRLERHRSGDGARLLRVITEAGIAWTVAPLWPGADRTTERRLKNRRNAPKLCPVCRGELSYRGVSKAPAGWNPAEARVVSQAPGKRQ